MLTDNIELLLGIQKINEQNIDNSDIDYFLIFGQDIGSEDHWVSVIGYYGYAIIIEYKDRCVNYNEIMTINRFIDQIYNIMIGIEPDRFYNVKRQHSMIVTSFIRKPITRETIDLYLLS